jgi:hypothetical protein
MARGGALLQSSNMTFYGLADYRLAGSELGEVIEIYPSLEEAEQALRDVLADEPDLVSHLNVVPVELRADLALS